MRKILFVFVSLFLIILTFLSMRDWAFNRMVDSLLTNKVKVVEPQFVDLTNLVILDAREKKEFEISHLPGAIWVGYKDFELDRVPNAKNDSILIYCSVGKRSEDIGIKLIEEGYTNVQNLHGGLFKWVNQGYEIENSEGKTNNVHPYSSTWGIWLKGGNKVY